MMTTPAPSLADRFANTLGEMRAAAAAEGTRKGPAGALLAAILSLLEAILALLVQFQAGTLAAAPACGPGARRLRVAGAGCARPREFLEPPAAYSAERSGGGGADGGGFAARRADVADAPPDALVAATARVSGPGFFPSPLAGRLAPAPGLDPGGRGEGFRRARAGSRSEPDHEIARPFPPSRPSAAHAIPDPGIRYWINFKIRAAGDAPSREHTVPYT
jgi:hypothetical protein